MEVVNLDAKRPEVGVYVVRVNGGVADRTAFEVPPDLFIDPEKYHIRLVSCNLLSSENLSDPPVSITCPAILWNTKLDGEWVPSLAMAQWALDGKPGRRIILPREHEPSKFHDIVYPEFANVFSFHPRGHDWNGFITVEIQRKSPSKVAQVLREPDDKSNRRKSKPSSELAESEEGIDIF